MSLTFNPSNHRYRLDGKAVRGVTGLISAGTPKDALIPWAAEQAGLWALNSLDQLPAIPYGFRPAVYEVGTPRSARRRGHREPPSTASPSRSTETGEADVDDEHMPFITGYLDFLDAWDITPILAERPCASRKH